MRRFCGFQHAMGKTDGTAELRCCSCSFRPVPEMPDVMRYVYMPSLVLVPGLEVASRIRNNDFKKRPR